MAGTRRAVAARMTRGFSAAWAACGESWATRPRRPEIFCPRRRTGTAAGQSFLQPGQRLVYQLGELERAAAAFQRAVELNPRDAESWNNLGKCLKELNRAGRFHRRLRPRAGVAARLFAGAAGPVHFAADRRTAGRGFSRLRTALAHTAAAPVLRAALAGQPIPGKTLFLHAEQGFGDGIQSARYAGWPANAAARVILECRPELKTLFNYSGVADEVIAFGEEIPPCDFYTSVISLPGLLGITLENIPGRHAVSSGSARRQPAAGRLANCKVGLVWAGSPTHQR